MKKNITINLFGALYNIDEDAYQLLDQYQKNMRAYFADREGGEEVAEDIERRVAELFAELKAEGIEAVTIEHVQDIIHRIGNPEEMEQEESQEATGTHKQEPPTPPQAPHVEPRGKRRLFRDSEDKVAGGVISGCCKYLDVSDPLPWRIIFVLLCLCTGTTLAIIYILAWIFIPLARTTADKLMMRGIPVTPHTLNAEIMQEAATRSANEIYHNGQASNHSTFNSLMKGLVTAGICFIAFICFAMLLSFLVPFLVLLVSLIVGFGTLTEIHLCEPDTAALLSQNPETIWLWLGFLLMVMVTICIPLGAIIAILRNWNRNKSMSFSAKLYTTISFFLCVALTVVLGFFAAVKTQQIDNLHSKRYNTQTEVSIDDDDDEEDDDSVQISVTKPSTTEKDNAKLADSVSFYKDSIRHLQQEKAAAGKTAKPAGKGHRKSHRRS